MMMNYLPPDPRQYEARAELKIRQEELKRELRAYPGDTSNTSGRNRRAIKALEAPFTSADARNLAPSFNGEQIGAPTALASWIGQRLKSLLRRIRHNAF